MSLLFNMLSPLGSRSPGFSTPQDSYEDEGSPSSILEKKVEKTLKHRLEMKLEQDIFSSNRIETPQFDYKPLTNQLINRTGASALEKSKSIYYWIFAEQKCFLVTDVFLGRGAFGTVYLGFTHEGKPCAIKRGGVKRNEIAFLKELSNPCSERSSISQLIAGDAVNQVLIMELADGNLTNALASLSRQQRLIVMRGILYGLKEAAQKNITHADLKPENVFIMKRDGYYAAKIGDFGLSAKNPENYEGGTPLYNPPEYYAHVFGSTIEPEDLPKVDIWSAMVSFCEIGKNMLSPSFVEQIKDFTLGLGVIKSKVKTRREFHKGVHDFFLKISQNSSNLFFSQPETPLDKLLYAMSAINPQDRLSAQEALNLFDGLFTDKPKESKGLSLDWEGETFIGESSEIDEEILSSTKKRKKTEIYEEISSPDKKRRKIELEEDYSGSSISDSESNSSFFSLIDLTPVSSVSGLPSLSSSEFLEFIEKDLQNDF